LYSYDDPKFEVETGHFTQVIWKDTTEVGCAVARNGNSIYVVARYGIHGNVVGHFEEQAQPLKRKLKKKSRL